MLIKICLLGRIEGMNEINRASSKEWLLFCRRFFHNPSCIGSVMPSSRFLARKMVRSVAWEQCGLIVELGAGTGSCTEYLLANKPQRTKVLVFEKDPVFRAQLAEKFAAVPLYDDAARLAEILAGEGIRRVDCIVSGLPFAMFSDKERQAILAQIHRVLPKGGQFITFQYSPQMYRELCLEFSEVRVGFAFFNLPPAIIYSCRR